jgi:hypothetical protein
MPSLADTDLSKAFVTVREFTVHAPGTEVTFSGRKRQVRVYQQVLYVGDENGMTAMFSPPWRVILTGDNIRSGGGGLVEG